MKLFSFFSRKNRNNTKQLSNSFQTGSPGRNETIKQLINNGVVGEVEDAYKENVWAYAGVKAIATNLASVPFKLRRRTTDGTAGEDILDPNNPWVKLFDNPNPLFDKTQLWRISATNYELDGEAFWILFGNDDEPISSPNQVPAYLETPRRERLEVRYNDDQTRIVGWTYKRNRGSSIDLEYYQVLRFFDYNPDSLLEGLSAVTVSTLAIGIDQKVHLYNDKFFKNGAQPAGHLLDKNIDSDLTEKEANSIREAWSSQYEGLNNAHKTPLLTNGVEYVATGTPQKDMDFQNLSKLIRDEIIGSLNVPKNQVGVYEDLNYANAKIADKQFYTNNLIPKMQYFMSVVNSKLLYRTGLECYFDLSTVEALKDDRSAKVEVAKGLFELGYSLNEVNQVQGLGMKEVSDKWADENVNAREGEKTTKSDGSIYTPEPEHDKNRDADKAQDKLSTALMGFFDSDFDSDGNSESKTKTDKSDYVDVAAFIEESVTPQALKVEPKIVSMLIKLRNSQLKRLDELGDKVNEYELDSALFDVEDEEKAFEKAVRPYAEEATLSSLGVTNEDLASLGVSDTSLLEGVLDNTEEELNNQFAVTNVFAIRTLHKNMRTALSNAIAEDMSIEDAKSEVRDVVKKALKATSGIAFSEMFSAATMARYTLINAVGDKVKKEWISKGDDKVRERHLSYASSGPQTLSHQYADGLRFPGDRKASVNEVAGCRCGIKIVLNEGAENA